MVEDGWDGVKQLEIGSGNILAGGFGSINNPSGTIIGGKLRVSDALARTI